MGTILALNWPVPISTLSFEHIFSSSSVDDAELVRLSRLRRSLAEMTNETAIQVESPIFAYRDAWIAFWQRNIRFVGSSARSRIPLRFEWRVQLISSTSSNNNVDETSHIIEYADPSPLLETACITFAAVSIYQRLAAKASTIDEAEKHASSAISLLEWLQTNVVTVARRITEPPPVRPPSQSLEEAMRNEVLTQHIRLRDPEVLSPYLVTAVSRAINAQLHCKRAITALGTSLPALLASSHFFSGARLFERAANILPAERSLRTAHCRITAIAYRYLSQALIDEGSPTNHGVAVALAREAVALDPSSNALCRFNEEMRERNRIEFGMQSVPTSGSIVLKFTRSKYSLNVLQDPLTSQYTITVPLPPT